MDNEHQEKKSSSFLRPKEAFAWWTKVEHASIWEELEDRGKFEMPDFKRATGFHDILQGEFHRKVRNIETDLVKQGKSLTGRQLGHMIIQHLRLTEVEGALLEFDDLSAVEQFGIHVVRHESIPEKKYLEILLRKQLECSAQFKETPSLCTMDVVQKGVPRSCDTLLSMLRIRIEEKNKKKH